MFVATDKKLLDQAFNLYIKKNDKRRASAVYHVIKTGSEYKYKERKPAEKTAYAHFSGQGYLRLSMVYISLTKKLSYTAKKDGDKIKITFYDSDKFGSGFYNIALNDRITNRVNFNPYLKKFGIKPKVGRYSMKVDGNKVVVDLGDYISAR